MSAWVYDRDGDVRAEGTAMPPERKRLLFAVFKEAANGAVECSFEPVRCDQCAHWGPWRQDGQRPKRFRADHDQLCDKLTTGSNPEDPCGFTTYYDNVKGADVETGPAFGCALFTAKEPA